MKPLCILLLCLLSLGTHAQKIYFTDTTNVWKVKTSYYNDMNPYTTIEQYYFAHDTVIGVFSYKGLKRVFTPGITYVREDTAAQKVYFRDMAGDSDILLLDYNLEVGDTFVSKRLPSPATPQLYMYKVQSIDSVSLNGVWHKIWRFTSRLSGGAAPIPTIIEGIGCVNDLFCMFWQGGVEPPIPAVYCFTNQNIAPPVLPMVVQLNNTTSCSYVPPIGVSGPSVTQQVAVSPNPASSILHIQAPGSIESLSITDVTGRQLIHCSPLSGSVNIDVSHLLPGVYLLRLNDSVQRFVKQ